MLFNICADKDKLKYVNPGEFVLIPTSWDDDGFRTEYELLLCEWFDTPSIGYVKIGCIGQISDGQYGSLPNQFERLPDGWFSLGQGEDYYEQLKLLLNPSRRTELLCSLRDIAFDQRLFNAIMALEPECRTVLDKSLLRSVTEFSVRYQFNRLAHGGVKLTRYSFTYTRDCDPKYPELGRNIMDFEVKPDSNPPSNVHVLIGSNGTGKTSMLKDMIRSIRGLEGAEGVFEYVSSGENEGTFANVICVAFSPFDDFSGLADDDSSCVVLNKTSGDLIKSVEKRFVEEFSRCMISRQKMVLWSEAIKILQRGDAAFQEVNIQQFMDNPMFTVPSPEEINGIFSPLSSGHKVVLLTVTSCVNRIEERSILFLDEPENHLHPPLLAALIRALSDLLIKRNGVAIIATHSPVVLQEVPETCVWKLYRSNRHLVAQRPTIHTFGESIGSLTKEVFGLETSKSGFYTLLREAVVEYGDYDKIYERYNGRFGIEAELVLRTILAAARRGETV